VGMNVFFFVLLLRVLGYVLHVGQSMLGGVRLDSMVHVGRLFLMFVASRVQLKVATGFLRGSLGVFEVDAYFSLYYSSRGGGGRESVRNCVARLSHVLIQEFTGSLIEYNNG